MHDVPFVSAKFITRGSDTDAHRASGWISWVLGIALLVAAALVIAARQGLSNAWIVVTSGLFVLFSLGLTAATVWVLISARGERAPVAGVFASFMIASLFRTMGIVPGGLGTFEATSVVTLHMMGVDLAAALSATLLFRGLSF